MYDKNNFLKNFKQFDSSDKENNNSGILNLSKTTSNDSKFADKTPNIFLKAKEKDRTSPVKINFGSEITRENTTFKTENKASFSLDEGRGINSSFSGKNPFLKFNPQQSILKTSLIFPTEINSNSNNILNNVNINLNNNFNNTLNNNLSFNKNVNRGVSFEEENISKECIMKFDFISQNQKEITKPRLTSTESKHFIASLSVSRNNVNNSNIQPMGQIQAGIIDRNYNPFLPANNNQRQIVNNPFLPSNANNNTDMPINPNTNNLQKSFMMTPSSSSSITSNISCDFSSSQFSGSSYQLSSSIPLSSNFTPNLFSMNSSQPSFFTSSSVSSISSNNLSNYSYGSNNSSFYTNSCMQSYSSNTTNFTSHSIKQEERPNNFVSNFNNDSRNLNLIIEAENESEDSPCPNRENLTEEMKEYERNMLIPKERKNDEKFKLLQTNKHLRKEQIPPNRSTRASEIMRIDQEDEDINRYNLFSRKKKIHSVKKIYRSELKHTNPQTGEIKFFKMFRDSDIGIHQYWQRHIIETERDEDVESDNDQISAAGYHTLFEMREAIHSYQLEGINILGNKKLLLHDQ